MLNRQKLILYISVWTLYAVFQAVVMQCLVPLPFWMLLLDAFFHASLFGALGVLIWNVIFYGNYDKISFFQRLINYAALALLSVAVWLALGYALDYVFLGAEPAKVFNAFLPLYALIGTLLYLLAVLFSRYKILEQSLEEKNSDFEEIQMPEESDMSASEECKEPAEILERVAVKSGHKIHVVLVPDIFYLEADGDYVHIHTEKGKYMKEQTMKYFEENLPAAQFVRIHRSYIVNVQAISRIEQYEKQNQQLTLKNGDKIKVSIGGYKLLKQKLGL